ncbi:MAG: InlB B-repeat-containing protein [Oscillospiraceae bacterium]|nr:InlB B-repeat-containing protein [Oscillospiraceae bacterium]
MRTLKLYRLQIILGAVAVAAVILTVLLVSGGSNARGLFITAVSGEVSVTNSAGAPSGALKDTRLRKDDIITVGSGGSCTITYRSKNNSENNYMVLGSSSQLVINDKFNGKSNGKVLLNQGSLLCSFKEESRFGIDVRTANSMVYPAKTITAVVYNESEPSFSTDIYTFMGNSKIQLYDLLGNTVNSMELLAEKKRGKVHINDEDPDNEGLPGGPVFLLLNVDISTELLPPGVLRELIIIAQTQDGFPYTAAELKETLDFLTEEDLNQDPEHIEEPAEYTEEPDDDTTEEVTQGTSTSFNWEQPSAVTTTRATSPAVTTAPPVTSSPGSTTTRSGGDDRMYNVIVIIDDYETIQEVRHGDSADTPEIPDIPGKTFIGWDKSFDNITQDTVITALFSGESVPGGNVHTVTLIVGDKTTTLLVEHGKAADIPDTIQLDGFTFLGWDTNFSNVTSDITVTARLQANEYIVNFVIDGYYHPTRVMHGQAAVPPFTPAYNSRGEAFTAWDKTLAGITSDTTITAIFAQQQVNHTVTFNIDGSTYYVTVASGGTASPPFTPVSDRDGRQFYGWDRSLTNITSDTTINALYS